MCEWFAQKSDLVILMFDCHKLDISDEFRDTIQTLCRAHHHSKIRVLLNKSDHLEPQMLMRVYGALQWSLGKVIQTPEVIRIYCGAFWEHPVQHPENVDLFEKEKADLLEEFNDLPKNTTVRKISQFIQRLRKVKVHARITSHLYSQMPYAFGKVKKQEELIQVCCLP